MSSYTIGQVAERTGFATSTLRFYEQHGLLEPAGRTDSGYRLYDDTSLARLGFIDRAKQLGCTLEEIANLAELWETEDCAPVQARLHELVTTKIAQAQRRTANSSRSPPNSRPQQGTSAATRSTAPAATTARASATLPPAATR